MNRRFLFLFIVVLGFGLGRMQLACSNLPAMESGPDWRQEFLSELGHKHIVPLYEGVFYEATKLSNAAEQFCFEPTGGSLEAVRNAWVNTRTLLRRTDVFSFGPYKEYPWRVGPKIDLWPVRPGEIEETLLEQPWLETNDLSFVTGFSKGLPAMEYLLFSDTITGRNPLERFVAEPSVCEYLILLGRDIVMQTEILMKAWSIEGDNYLGELLLAGQGSAIFSTISMAFSEVINQMGFTIENIRELKLAKPAGISTSVVDFTLLESYLSQRSLEEMRAALEGLEDVYEGAYIKEAGGGIRELIAADAKFIDTDVQGALGEVYAALDGFDVSLMQAIDSESGAERITDLYDSLTKLQRVFQVDLYQHLGVTLTFNDNDGD